MEKLHELVNDEGHRKLMVVSIVGFGGIGKTTLATEIYRKLGQQFECRAFVRTSQKPDMRRIFVSMLSQICPHQPPDNWTVHSLISTIRTHLQDKRYFIIVEDVCATSTWDMVKCALPDSNCCSRILTTTESEDLALLSCDHDPKYVYKMQPLGEDDSRKLFFSTIFGTQHECSPDLREISYNVISKCGGLPLALVTVASVLSSQPGLQDQLDYVSKSIGYSLLTDPTPEGMKQVLDLSYNSLPQDLKACILYTGLYEEDTIIWKDDLVNQWIAEGFIQPSEGRDMKEIAWSFFDRLISGKLILPVDINRNGDVLSCVVHHMVLNLLIRYKSTEENFATAIHHSQATMTLADKVRRLSLQFGNAEDAIPPTNMRLSQVRTLVFWGVFTCSPTIVQFHLLQVLILHFWGDKDSISFDLTRISELFRLRYLKVTSNVTLELGNKIRGLQSLETLTIDATVNAVPSDIVHLPGLLHLSLSADTKLPNGIGHMASLRTFGRFDLCSNSIENVHSLGMLTNLRDLQLTCSRVLPESMDSIMQLMLTSILGRLCNLKSLTLVPGTSTNAKLTDEAGATGVTISGGFSSLSSAPYHLQSLEVSSRICIFYWLPKWIGQLQKLCILKIGLKIIDRDDVDVLRGLPALVALSLYSKTKPSTRIVVGKTGFPVIKYFKFKCCDPFLKFEEGAMPNLCKLKLVFDADDVDPHIRIPVGIKNLSNLKEVSAKIGCAGPDESQKTAIELAFRDAIRVHARCERVNIQCVKQIIGGKDDQCRLLRVEDYGTPVMMKLDDKWYASSYISIVFRGDMGLEPLGSWPRNSTNKSSHGRPAEPNKEAFPESDRPELLAWPVLQAAESHRPCTGVQDGRKKRWVKKTTSVVTTASPDRDDGYTWRKYGSKSVRGSKYPRDYYRCMQRTGCSARKEVQRRDGGDPVVVYNVCYSGEHSCGVLQPPVRSDEQGSHTKTIAAAGGQIPLSMPHAHGAASSVETVTSRGQVVMSNDGYSWRKYGQKDIPGAKHPRSYYRCAHRTTQGCKATKRVQRKDDAQSFDVIYYGQHTCNQIPRYSTDNISSLSRCTTTTGSTSSPGTDKINK